MVADGAAWVLTLAKRQAPLDAALTRLAEDVGPERLLVVVRSREMEDRVRHLLPFPAQVQRLSELLGTCGHVPILDEDILPDEVVHALLAAGLPPDYKGAWRDHLANEYLGAIQLLATNGVRPPYPGTGDKMQAQLEAAHRRLLAALRPHNEAGRYAAFQRVLSAARRRGRFHSRHPNVHTVALFGLEWLSTAEEAALEQVVKDVVDVQVFLVGRDATDRDADAWPALAHTDRAVRWATHWTTARVQQAGAVTADGRAASLDALFSPRIHAPVPLPGVHVSRATDPDDEVAQTAARIADALAAGSSADQIAVVSPRLERYTAALREQFTAHGIPFTLRHSGRLAATPPGGLLALILADLDHDHERDRFLDLAAHPLLRWRITLGDRQVYLNAHFLRRALARRGFTPRGLAAWTRVLERLARPEPSLRGDDETEKARTSAAFEEQRQAALALLTKLDRLRQVRSADAFFDALRDLLDDLAIVRNTQRALRHLPDPHGLTRALQATLDLLDETQRAYRLQEPGAKVAPARETLMRRLQAATLPLPADRSHGVQVLGYRNAYGLRFTHVFLLGATRDDLPPPRGNDRLIHHLERRFGSGRLRRIDPGLEARRIFHALLSDTSGDVHILVPENVDGDPRSPSVLVQELQEAYVLEAAAVPAERNRTMRDLHREAARSGATWEGAPATMPAQRALVAARADPTDTGPYNGHLHDPHVIAAASLRGLGGQHPVSPSHLNRFAVCPQRSLWHHIARIRGTDERDDDVSPLDRGRILHMILELWSKALLEREGSPAYVRDPPSEEHALLRVALDVLERTPHDGISWSAYEEELLSGLAGTHPHAHRPPGLLKGVLDDLVETGAGIVAVERSFGGTDQPVYVAGQTTRISIAGQIDRIEQAADGLQVVDIKTGKRPAMKDIDGGLDFQLALYVIAAQAVLGRPVARAAYLQARRAQDQVKRTVIPGTKDPPDHLDRLLQDTARRLDEAVAAARSGHYPLTLFDERTAGCQYCDQNLMCGRRAHHTVPRREHHVLSAEPHGYVADRARALVDAPDAEQEADD